MIYNEGRASVFSTSTIRNPAGNHSGPNGDFKNADQLIIWYEIITKTVVRILVAFETRLLRRIEKAAWRAEPPQFVGGVWQSSAMHVCGLVISKEAVRLFPNLSVPSNHVIKLN